MNLTRRQALALAAGLPLAACLPPSDGSDLKGAPDGAALLSRIAFGSCSDQERPQPIWSSVLDYRPDLFIFGGDNVYGDVKSAALTELKAAYAKAMTVDGFRRLRESVPHVATWDDHDYGANDAGVEFPHKQATKRLFLDFWNVPADDPRRGRDGLYHAWIFGPAGRRVQVILLDTRWFRSALTVTDRRGAPGRERYLPDLDPAKTMLGEAQWAWLAGELAKPVDLRLIVSSIQVVVDGHGFERWGNLPLERQRLYRLVRDTNANGVVFLSGDRHLGALYRETEGVPYPLLEATSSGISRHFTNSREPGPNRLGEVYGQAHFGTIDVDWTSRQAVIALRGLEGQIVRRFDAALDALRARSFA